MLSEKDQIIIETLIYILNELPGFCLPTEDHRLKQRNRIKEKLHRLLDETSTNKT